MRIKQTRWMQGLALVIMALSMTIGGNAADSVSVASSDPAAGTFLNYGTHKIEVQVNYTLTAATVARLSLGIQLSEGEYTEAGTAAIYGGTGTATVTMEIRISESASAAKGARNLLPPNVDFGDLSGPYNPTDSSSSSSSGVVDVAQKTVKWRLQMSSYTDQILASSQKYFYVPDGATLTVIESTKEQLETAVCFIGVDNVDPDVNNAENVNAYVSMQGTSTVDVYITLTMANDDPTVEYNNFLSLVNINATTLGEAFGTFNVHIPIAVNLNLADPNLRVNITDPDRNGIEQLKVFSIPSNLFPAGYYWWQVVLTRPGKSPTDTASLLASNIAEWRITPNAGPELTITSPALGSLTNSTNVTVTGTVFDFHGVKQVTVNGVEATLTPQTMAQDGRTTDPVYATWTALVPMHYGYNQSVTASAIDSKGYASYNAASVHFNIVESGLPESFYAYDSAPEITLNSPIAGSTYWAPQWINISGTIKDADVLAEIFINGEAITPNWIPKEGTPARTESSFVIAYWPSGSPDEFPTGRYPIRISAVDWAGNFHPYLATIWVNVMNIYRYNEYQALDPDKYKTHPNTSDPFPE